MFCLPKITITIIIMNILTFFWLRKLCSWLVYSGKFISNCSQYLIKFGHLLASDNKLTITKILEQYHTTGSENKRTTAKHNIFRIFFRQSYLIFAPTLFSANDLDVPHSIDNVAIIIIRKRINKLWNMRILNQLNFKAEAAGWVIPYNGITAIHWANISTV